MTGALVYLEEISMHANELPICTACGSQFDADDSILPEHCQICDVSIPKTTKRYRPC